MPPAIIGGVIAGAGAVGAAAVGSSATKKAAQATTQAADQSAAVIRENYDKSAQALAPWQSQGLQANALINSALGLTPSQSYGQPQATYQPAQNALANYANPGDFYNPSDDPQMYRGGWYQGSDPFQTVGLNGGQNAPGTMSMTGGVTAPNPRSALDTYLNSTGYQFQLGEGMKAVNSGFAGRGLLQSGAALKSLNDYGQGMAKQGFGQWLGALGNQQDTGFRAASAQAGVSQGLGNSLAGIYQNQGANQANAALVSGQNNAALVNSLAGIGAGILGGQGGSSGSSGNSLAPFYYNPKTQF